MTTTEGWDGILEPGETILWQDRPDQSLQPPGIRDLPGMLFGLAFTAFALFWMVGAAQGGGYFWLFGLVHFSVGLALTLGTPLLSWLRRRGTWYTLTNQRALIATQLPLQARSLKSYPITTGMQITLHEGPPDSLHFATESRRTRFGVQLTPTGFDQISGGRKVLALMRSIQRGSQ